MLGQSPELLFGAFGLRRPERNVAKRHRGINLRRPAPISISTLIFSCGGLVFVKKATHFCAGRKWKPLSIGAPKSST
jgi:hypothetical protein